MHILTFNRTVNSVDCNKALAEWNYVHEDLQDSVAGVTHWILLLLWNVSCWEGAGCEDRVSVEQPLLGLGGDR